MNGSASKSEGRTTLEAILDAARWAPSGDNEQCWRFEIVADDHVVVHGYDTRHHCVYDLDGTASQIGIGALLETMTIAASRFQFRIEATRVVDSPIEHPRIAVRFVKDAGLAVDPLSTSIETRSVYRRALATRALTRREKEALSASVGPDFDVAWYEGTAQKWVMARLLFASAKIRMVIPEAYAVHCEAIAWGAKFSDDRVPEAAVGLDPMTAVLMRWVMRSWQRVLFFNRFLAGTWVPRIQLDMIPALACAGHFVLVGKKPSRSIDDYIAAGRAVQRFWLTATSLGLQLQPEVTPLIFARYSRGGIAFTTIDAARAMASAITNRLDQILGRARATNAVFMGRVGAGSPASSRSLRLPLDRLMHDPQVEVGQPRAHSRAD